MWKDISKRVWGTGIAFSGIVGLGGVEADILNWLGWLKINPYVTGAAFGVMGVCGVLYVGARWADGIIALWNRIWNRLRGLDKRAMAILRKEEPRLEALRLEIAEYAQRADRDGSHPRRIMLDLLALEDLLHMLGVPTPATIGTGRDVNIVFTEWAMFIPLLLVRIRHGNISDVRATLDNWSYEPPERLDDMEAPD